MADDTTGAAAGGEATTIERSAGGDGPLSLLEAARSLTDARRKDAAGERREQSQDNSGEARETATAEESASQEAGTAQETGPGETQGDDQARETEPPIEPPRSWTKEDKELFKGLPRETQERLADRERSREADFLRRQNEAAEHTKGLTAKEQAAEQVRTQYEQALPMLMQALQEQHQGEFADVRTIADVERLAREDWPRYVLWDAQQKKIAAVQQQVQAAQTREQTEKATKWNTFAKDEDAKFLEKAPEFADPKVLTETTQRAGELLKDLGFTGDELGKLWNGQADLSLRDHRVQLLLRDAVKYREAKAKATAAQVKTVPAVQRPGPARSGNADAEEKVRNLEQRLTQSGSLQDAVALRNARRQAR